MIIAKQFLTYKTGIEVSGPTGGNVTLNIPTIDQSAVVDLQ